MDNELIELFTPPVSYCIDANYYKGTTVQQFIMKRRRQLVIVYDDFNRRVKSDQTCVGTVTPNFKNSALGNGTKIIEDTQTPAATRPGFRVRKLTQKECWRLMGFDDQDFESAKFAMNEHIYNGNNRCGSQLYKQAGNSIVVDVLLHIMENLYDAMPYLFEDMTIGSFFSGIGAFEKALTHLAPIHGGEPTESQKEPELKQFGYINGENNQSNRVYEADGIARTLAAEAGGGGAKTGWYRLPDSASPPRSIIIDDTMGFETEPRIYGDICPSLRASRSGLKAVERDTHERNGED